MNELVKYAIDNKKTILAFINSITKNKEFADDAYQDLFFKLSSYTKEVLNVKAFVFQTAKHTTIRTLKLSRIVAGNNKLLDTKFDISSFSTPENILIQEQTQASVMNSFKELQTDTCKNKYANGRSATKQYEAVKAVVDSDFDSLTSVADRHGVNRNTFKLNYFFGINKLRAKIEYDGFYISDNETILIHESR